MQMLDAAAGTGLRVPARELRSLHLEAVEQAINNLALLSVIGQSAVPENMKSSRSPPFPLSPKFCHQLTMPPAEKKPTYYANDDHRQDRLETLYQRLSQEQEQTIDLAAGRRATWTKFLRAGPARANKARGANIGDMNLFRVRNDKGKASRASAGSNQVVAQVIVSARFSQVFMQWEKSHEVLERHIVISVHDRCAPCWGQNAAHDIAHWTSNIAAASSDHDMMCCRIMCRLAKEHTLVGIACIAPQLAMCWAGLTRFDLSRDAVQLFHTQYDKQGRPDDFRPFKVLMGILAVPQLATLQHSYENLLGQIDRPATVKRKEREFTAALRAACPDYMGLMLSSGSANSFEYMWEPDGSPRHSQRRKLVVFLFEKYVHSLKKSSVRLLLYCSELPPVLVVFNCYIFPICWKAARLSSLMQEIFSRRCP